FTTSAVPPTTTSIKIRTILETIQPPKKGSPLINKDKIAIIGASKIIIVILNITSVVNISHTPISTFHYLALRIYVITEINSIIALINKAKTKTNVTRLNHGKVKKAILSLKMTDPFNQSTILPAILLESFNLGSKAVPSIK